MGNHVNKLLWLFCKLVDSVRKKALGGVYTRKLAPARVSYRDDFLISYRVYIMTGSFHISLFEGTLHVDKIHAWFKIANITHALPVPVYRQTDFTPKHVSRLHDTVARFRTRVKFSPRYNNRGELAPGKSSWHDILWRYHVNKCRTMGGNRSELAPARKSPRCHVNTPLENRHNLGENIPLGQSPHMIVCNTTF